MFQTKFVEKIKPQILYSIRLFFILKNRAMCEIMWKNIIERGGPRMTKWRTRIACCIPKATNTHSGRRTLIGFPTVRMVARTHFNVSIQVQCPPCTKFVANGIRIL